MAYTWIDIANEEIASSVRNKLNGAGAQIPQLQSQITQNKAMVDILYNTSIDTATGVADTNYIGYPYMVKIPVAGVETNVIPIVIPRHYNCQYFYHIAHSDNGYIQVWLSSNALGTLVIPTILLIKEA